MKLSFSAALLAGGVALAPLASAAAAEPQAVLATYVNIAQAGYEDSLVAGKALQKAVDALIAAPTEANLKAARQAWVAARVPYQQTEVYRFGNPIVDDWEGKVNAWPLDEGLIDYVSADAYGTESGENILYTMNVIANQKLKVNGKPVDAGKITKQLLADTLHEAEEVEANVATGYHAIEFLLWGQDLNGNGPGAGARPASDFDTKACTGGNCDRRVQYLKAATDLLIDDLAFMAAQWAPKGAARTEVMQGNPASGLTRIVTGMGSLSYGELAGERMKLGLMLHDPEEEHDCFSDNTHASHYYDALGIQNVYLGQYTRIDGKVVQGPGLSALVATKDKAIDSDLKGKLGSTMNAMTVLVKTAEGGEAYDQMIGAGNQAGNQKVQSAIDALVAQTKSLEKAVAILDLSAVQFEGSDSLDAPDKVGH